MCKQDDAPDPLVGLYFVFQCAFPLLVPYLCYLIVSMMHQINACNGRQCGETFKGPNSPNKPAVWTENWTSLYGPHSNLPHCCLLPSSQINIDFELLLLYSYQTFGEEPLKRSAEDIAFQVALFIARNGSFINYYMVVFLFTLSLYFEYTRNEC